MIHGWTRDTCSIPPFNPLTFCCLPVKKTPPLFLRAKPPLGVGVGRHSEVFVQPPVRWRAAEPAGGSRGPGAATTSVVGLFSGKEDDKFSSVPRSSVKVHRGAGLPPWHDLAPLGRIGRLRHVSANRFSGFTPQILSDFSRLSGYGKIAVQVVVQVVVVQLQQF